MVKDERVHTSEQSRKFGAALFVCVLVAWLILDYVTKRYFDAGTFQLGDIIAGPFAGIFQLVLVHNTGAAWGIFGDSTFALGIFSAALCIAIIGFYIWQRNELGVLETIGLALVASGGIGNAIDRFVSGYVVDFIEFAFIDFPVFNIADIGVTCGIVIFFLGYLISWKKEGK